MIVEPWLVGVCAELSLKETPPFAAIEKVRFREVVKPGDQLVITATVQAARAGVVKIAAEARVDDKVVAEGNLTFALVPREDD